MRFSPKDIVLTPFPFTHFDSEKVRPTLVLSSQNIHGDYIVLFLTSQVEKYKGYAENVYVKKNTSNNLAADSLVITSKIATLSDAMIHEKIGVIGAGEWIKVRKEIRKILSL